MAEIEVPIRVTVSFDKDQPTQAEVHLDGPNETTAEQADQRRRRRKVRTVNEIPDHLEGTTAEKADHEDELSWLGKEALSTDTRNDLPDSAFAIPSKRAYPIHDRSHAANALARASGKPEEDAVRAAVKRKYPDMGKIKKAEINLLIERIWKDSAQCLLYGVVLEPELMDSQGDIVSADEIQKAAHRFLVESRKTDIQHDSRDAGVSVVESYCAPENTIIAGEPVTKGAWVLVVKVHDPEVWANVRSGNLTGFSIGGSGVRVPTDA